MFSVRIAAGRRTQPGDALPMARSMKRRIVVLL